jgi:C-terminal processing protease CtpA/Prc
MVRSKVFSFISFLVAASLLLSSCSLLSTSTPTVPTQVSIPSGTEPVKISGEFTYTNGFAVETYYVEQAVGLTDMHGFVIRDMLWEIPIQGQTLGYLKIDTAKKTGTYFIDLPAKPEGTLNDVANDNNASTGVQIFSVGYSPNLAGGPFSEGDDPSFGWPSYLASVKTDTENKQEVVGGKLLVWAPDGNQKFPTEFGADTLLFTADDPVGPIPAGWSVVDLGTTPFTVIREENPKVELYEPLDVATKDYSTESYTKAFQSMFDFLKTNYAFNDIQGKAPNWDEAYNAVFPMIQIAETQKDPTAFYLALRQFTWFFKDGHVGLSGGNIENTQFQQAVQSGYGLAVRETDDGTVIVTYVTAGGPADKAGILKGAVIKIWAERPVLEAIRLVQPLALPVSTDFSLHYQQDRYLTRAPVGSIVDVNFANPGELDQTVTLTAVKETESFNQASIYVGYDPNALPVTFEIKSEPTGSVGYIKISSNYDDLNLIIRLFNRALKTFTDNNVAGIIIDMRQDPGGANLGLAGFLDSKEIQMGQLEYFSTKTGKFEPEGPRERVLPNVEQYTFKKMALLVDQACSSACELEAYGFSQVPGMEVIGMYPSAGIEAEVARGQFLLPEGFSMQAPTGRFTLPDGSIFLEGKGVQPTTRIPLTAANLLSSDDVVLTSALNYILKPKGAGVIPAGNPIIASIADSVAAMQGGQVKTLDALAPEQYSNIPTPGTPETYTIFLTPSEKVTWVWGWCANDKATTDQNYSQMDFKFSLNGTNVPLDQFAALEGTAGSMYCRYYGAQLSSWPEGEHHLKLTLTFKTEINDGTAKYPADVMEYDYTVYVAP